MIDNTCEYEWEYITTCCNHLGGLIIRRDLFQTFKWKKEKYVLVECGNAVQDTEIY